MMQFQKFPRIREVARIGQEINHDLPRDLITFFENLNNQISSIFKGNHSLLLSIYQAQTKTLAIYQTEQGHVTYEPDYKFEGASRYIIANKTPLFIRQRSKEVLPFEIESWDSTKLEESFIFVPLMLRGEVIGTLSIQHPEPNAYTEEDLFIFELLANHVALAIRNIRLFTNLTLLSDTGQLLTQLFESSSALQAIVDNIKDATLADIVVLYPYKQAIKSFVSPPYIAGTLSDADSRSMMHPRRSDDIAWLMQEAEIMSLVGQSTFEIAHRLDQDLGLIGHTIQQIMRELTRHLVSNPAVIEKLDYIANAVTNVLKLDENLKFELKAGWGNEAAVSLKKLQTEL